MQHSDSKMEDSFVINKREVLEFYKREILEKMRAGMERTSLKNNKTISLPHIFPPILAYFLQVSGSTMLTKSDVEAFFGGPIERDFSQSQFGSFATVEAPVTFANKNGKLEIRYGYVVCTKGQPTIRLN